MLNSASFRSTNIITTGMKLEKIACFLLNEKDAWKRFITKVESLFSDTCFDVRQIIEEKKHGLTQRGTNLKGALDLP